MAGLRVICRGALGLLCAACASIEPVDQVAKGEPEADPIGRLIERQVAPATLAVTTPEPQIVAGTGQFYASPGQSARSGGARGDLVSVDLDDASIADAAETILGDILGENYLVDEGVTGMITLRTTEPVARDVVLSIFEGALQSRGAALIREDGVYRIAPLAEASIGPQQFTVRGSEGEAAYGYGVQVVPLRFVSAKEMSALLEPISSPGAILRVDEARNLLMLGGSRREVQSLLEAVNIFDVDWLRGMSFALLPVKTAEPEEIARELTTIFSSAEDGVLNGVVRFVPNARLNAVLVISSQPGYLSQARRWMERIDNPAASGADQLFVYNVQNRPARELEEVMSAFLSNGRGRSGDFGSDAVVQPGATARTIGEGGGGDLQAGGSFGGDGFGQSGGGQTLRIIADDANNSLIVYASPFEFQRVAKMLEKLDVLPNQVLIEATIAEVRLRDELQYGLRWFFENAESSFTFSDVSNGAVAQSFPGFSYLFSDNDARVALNALSGVTDVKVLSSPSLMVLDNRTARLQIGDQVPIATQSAVSTVNPDSPIVNSVALRDTGVILNITPRVNDSGVIILDIEQEVSGVASTTSSGIDSPTIQQRRVETTVAVHDGDSLALGGLIEDRSNVTSTGVPLLEKIPLLGEAFKSKRTTNERTELLILISPKVVRDRVEAQEVTDEFRERLENLRPLLDDAR